MLLPLREVWLDNMGDYPIGQRDFSLRLFLGADRDSMPRNALRRCQGSSPELGPVVRSRFGSTTRYTIPNILTITRFSGSHYLSDGGRVWQGSTQIATGFGPGRPTFLQAPPAIGLQPYLFMCGANKLIKINPLGAVTNWGIQPPTHGPTLTLGNQDSTIIESFASSPSSTWVPTGATVTDETASMRINPTGGPWSVVRTFGTPQNYAVYSNGDISLDTDIVRFTVNLENPSQIIWLQLAFDVNLGDFSADYYTTTISVVGPTTNVNVVAPSITITAAAFQWIPLALAKSQFTRIGTDTQKDWSTVKAIRIQGGNIETTGTPPVAAPAAPVHVTNLQQYGGFALGSGPAALPGGGGTKRCYLVTFGNSITGNDSNPNGIPSCISGIALQPVLLSNIPTSSDIQVGNRKIWMSEDDGPFALLDTINDNSSINDTDRVASSPAPIVLTPWTKLVSVPSGYYVDGGNGYLFRVMTAGTTGSNVPNWNIPTAAWVARGVFELGDIILPNTAYKYQTTPIAFQCITPGVTGPVEPNWASATVPNPDLTDHQVVWQRLGSLTTNDNSVVWLCIGQNSLPVVGNEVVQYDNTVFPHTIGDAIFFGGSMFATRDSAPDRQLNVYISTPGKAEGYANILSVGTNEEDLPQKLIVWDEQIYVMTTRYLYPLTRTPPDMAVGDLVVGAEGTVNPFTVTQTPYGIAYNGISGIRLFNNVSNDYLGYEAMAPIFNDRPVENIPLFDPSIACHARTEMMFSDGANVFAYSFESKSWRTMLGLVVHGMYYHDEEDIIHFALASRVVDWEPPGVFADDGAPIPVEWQSASDLRDATQQSMSKRIWLDVDCAGQILTPTLCLDENEITMPVITNTKRGRIPIPFQEPGRIYAVRLTGNVLARVSWFGVVGDMRNGR